MLKRHGISRLPQIAGDKTSKKPFKRYPISFWDTGMARRASRRSVPCSVLYKCVLEHISRVRGHAAAIRQLGVAPMLLGLLHSLYRRTYGMERDTAVKLIRALIGAGFVADDQRADTAIEKAALEAGLNREQLKAALKYAKEQKWIAETNKAAWSVITQAGIDAVYKE